MPRSLTDVESLLIPLVEIDSTNPGLTRSGVGEAAVGRFVAEWARAHGLEVSVEQVIDDRCNVVVVARGSGGGRSLMLNAHLDVVGVEGYEDPFRCAVTDDSITGRGTLDTKAGLAAALVVADRAKRMNLRGDVVVAAVIDEEFLSIGTEALIASSNWKTDAALVLEPTDLVMATQHRGFVWGAITVHGVAAHGSRPDLGVDAIAHAGPILAGIGELQRRLANTPNPPATGPGSVHASLIAGGSELSSYPDTCRIDIERRITPAETIATFSAELEELAALCDAAATTTVEVGMSREPLAVDAGEPIVRELTTSASLAGVTLAPAAASFWTDAALLHAAGVPSVVFGPSGGGIHSTNEWIDRDSLGTFTSILEELVRSWCA